MNDRPLTPTGSLSLSLATRPTLIATPWSTSQVFANGSSTFHRLQTPQRKTKLNRADLCRDDDSILARGSRRLISECQTKCSVRCWLEISKAPHRPWSWNVKRGLRLFRDRKAMHTRQSEHQRTPFPNIYLIIHPVFSLRQAAYERRQQCRKRSANERAP